MQARREAGVKLLRSDGRSFEVRDIGPILFHLRHGPDAPLPIIASEIVDDDAARETCRRLVAMGLYERVENV